MLSSPYFEGRLCHYQLKGWAYIAITISLEKDVVANIKEVAMLLLTQMRISCHHCNQLERGCLYCQHGGRGHLIISSLKDDDANLKEDTYIATHVNLKEEVDDLKEEIYISVDDY